MIVLDASAAVEWLLQTPIGIRVQQRVLSTPTDLHAPYLIDVEVAHALRGLVRSRKITSALGAAALEDLIDFRLNRYVHLPFLRRIWALRDNLTAYDALYIALAEELRSPLITCDAKLASAPGHHAKVELITP